MLGSPIFWYALAAWLKTQAENAISLCLHIANTLDGTGGQHD